MAVVSHSDLEALWIASGGSPQTADVAAAVAQAESGGDTTRINNTAYPKLPGYHPPASGNLREYSVGLWQINELAHPQYTTAQLLTARGNAIAATAIASGGASFSAWSTYKSGAYKAFLRSGGTPTPQPGPVDSPVGTVQAARAFSGWADLRQSVNHHLPNQLERSRRSTSIALRGLAHRRKVKG